MLVLVLGISAGIDPLLCTLRGLIGGMVGWVAGALWAFVMCQSEPAPAEPYPTETTPPDEQSETHAA